MSLLQAYLKNPRTRRALSLKPGDKGFSLIELVVVIAVLAILIVIALPNFQGVTDDAALSSGKKYLVDAFAECTIIRARGQAGTVAFTTPPLINGGAFTLTPNNATNCPIVAGTTMTFTPALNTVPEFTIELYSGEKSCALQGQNGALPSYGCTANNEW